MTGPDMLSGDELIVQHFVLKRNFIKLRGILHCPSKVVYTFLRRAIEIEIGIAIVIEMK